jgi:hypothetical protein
VKVRPPRQGQSQPRHVEGEVGRDGAGPRTMPAMSAMPAGTQDRRGRTEHPPESYGEHADRIRGN